MGLDCCVAKKCDEDEKAGGVSRRLVIGTACPLFPMTFLCKWGRVVVEMVRFGVECVVECVVVDEDDANGVICFDF